MCVCVCVCVCVHMYTTLTYTEHVGLQYTSYTGALEQYNECSHKCIYKHMFILYEYMFIIIINI